MATTVTTQGVPTTWIYLAELDSLRANLAQARAERDTLRALLERYLDGETAGLDVDIALALAKAEK